MGLTVGIEVISTYSGPQGNCAGVTLNADGTVSVRNTKRGPSIQFTRGEWDAFIGGAADGEFTIG
jgi:hypothetical protein